MSLNGVINGKYKASTAKADVKVKELTKAVWRTRDKWGYPALVVAFGPSYYYMNNFFLGIVEQGLWLSNLTANFFILIVIWLWFNQDISSALWQKAFKKKRGYRAPFLFQMISLIIMVFCLIMYLSLFGYETRW